MADFKIFEGTVESALKDCLDAGMIPMTTEEIVKAKKEGTIPINTYDTRLFFNTNTGEVRNLSVNELRQVLSGELEGNLLFLDYVDDGLYGYGGLGSSGRFVGITLEAQDDYDLKAEIKELKKRMAALERKN